MNFKTYLKQAGYHKFKGTVSSHVYQQMSCPHPEKGTWMSNPSLPSFQCTGCKLYCETDDPTGFQILLPLFEHNGHR